MSGKKIFLIVGIGTLIAVGGLYWCISYQITPIRQVIASDLTVGHDWQELSIVPPVNARRDMQYITLHIEGYRHPVGGPFEIALYNGKVVKPEIHVVDEQGDTLFLEDNMRGGNEIGFSPRIGFPDAPRKYVKVRVRSDIPFTISKLAWLDMNLK